MVLNNADGLTASAEADIGRGLAMGLSRARMGAMEWELWELKPWELKQIIWKV